MASLEERLKALELVVKEIKDLCMALGKQNSELKTTCNGLETDIKILKEGGNI